MKLIYDLFILIYLLLFEAQAWVSNGTEPRQLL